MMTQTSSATLTSTGTPTNATGDFPFYCSICGLSYYGQHYCSGYKNPTTYVAPSIQYVYTINPAELQMILQELKEINESLKELAEKFDKQ